MIDTSTAQTHSEHGPALIAHVDCDSLAITAPSVPRSVSREPRLAQLSLLCRVADGRTKKSAVLAPISTVWMTSTGRNGTFL